jgi:hypothetical protein
MTAQQVPREAAAGQLCRCGHERDAHSHYRKGSSLRMTGPSGPVSPTIG